MSCTIEKALADAKALVERLRDHDDAAESLIEQTTALSKRVEAMKQYQEEIQELNEVARHRPRSTLVMGIQQENRQIRELQQENKELRTSLEEHQSALELIMSKYREQMFRLLMASKKDDPGIIMKLKEQHSKIDMVHRNSCEGFFLDASRHILEAPQHGLERRHLEANQNELQAHVDQITEMAAVMRKAIEIDEQQGCKEQERIFQLEQENKGLREILQITRESFLNLRKDDASETYKVRITSATEENIFVKYTATLLDIYKTGEAAAEKDSEITFIRKISCTNANLVKGKQYLIMGKEALQIKHNFSFKYIYPLDSSTWIEYWPTDTTCPSCQAFVANLDEFAEDIFLNGCENA